MRLRRILLAIVAIACMKGGAMASPFEQLLQVCAASGLSLDQRVEAIEALGYGPANEFAVDRQRHAAAVAMILGSDQPISEIAAKGGAMIAKVEMVATMAFEKHLADPVKSRLLSRPGGYEVLVAGELAPVSKTRAFLISQCSISAGLGLGGGGERVRFPAGAEIRDADFATLAGYRNDGAATTIAFPKLARHGGTLPDDWPELGLVAVVFRSDSVKLQPQE